MKTDQLIAMLATQAGPVEARATQRRFTGALGWGLFAAVLGMALALGVREDIAQAALQPMFWVKLLFPATIAASALVAAARLARPGMRLGLLPMLPAAAIAALWLVAAVVLAAAAPAERSQLVYGETWRTCPVSITLLALPVLAASLWAIKGLAPTRLALAGASAGLLAGAAGATVYALHCPEMAAPFLAVWYVLGMAIPTVLGALLAPRLLRW
jgi:hypothetical protein